MSGSSEWVRTTGPFESCISGAFSGSKMPLAVLGWAWWFVATTVFVKVASSPDVRQTLRPTSFVPRSCNGVANCCWWSLLTANLSDISVLIRILRPWLVGTPARTLSVMESTQETLALSPGSYSPILPGDSIVSVNGMTAYSKLQKDTLPIWVCHGAYVVVFWQGTARSKGFCIFFFKELTSTTLQLSIQRWGLAGSAPTFAPTFAPAFAPTGPTSQKSVCFIVGLGLMPGPTPTEPKASEGAGSPQLPKEAAGTSARRPCLRQPIFWLFLGSMTALELINSVNNRSRRFCASWFYGPG